MKVDRVILVSNNNRMYSDFWNNLSYTYKIKFGIQPTLVFFGTESEKEILGLSENYGNIIYEKKIEGIADWQYTWALFYFTKYYSDDTCIVMGIDQIPLGTYFLSESIESVSENNYVMLIDDIYKYQRQYPTKWDEGGYSPSAYHIAKGKTFMDIFNFEETFELELRKIISLNLKTMWGNGWGMDEAYSSHTLRNFRDQSRISALSKTKDFLERRIDCHRSVEVPYSIERLNNNNYIECHSVRPYLHHKNYLDKMFNDIPYFINLNNNKEYE